MPYLLDFIQFFEKIHLLSDESKEFLRNKVQVKSLPKGELVVEKGQVMEMVF
jgi:CRP-like cAMP-binding protein